MKFTYGRMILESNYNLRFNVILTRDFSQEYSRTERVIILIKLTVNQLNEYTSR